MSNKGRSCKKDWKKDIPEGKKKQEKMMIRKRDEERRK